MKQREMKKWIAVAFVVALLVPSLGHAEYGGTTSLGASNESFDAKLSAADGILSEAGSELQSLTPQEQEAVQLLDAKIKELKKKKIISEEQAAQLQEYRAAREKLLETHKGIAAFNQNKVNALEQAEQESRDTEAAILSKQVQPPALSFNQDLLSAPQECGGQEIQSFMSGIQSMKDALPQLKTKMTGGLSQIFADQREDTKENRDKLRAAVISDIAKAEKQSKKGEDIEEDLVASKDDEKSFFGLVGQGIDLMNKWQQKSAGKLVNLIFDAADENDAVEDRKLRVAGIASSFSQNLTAFVSPMAQNLIAAAQRAQDACERQERRMRGVVGAQPSRNSLKGLQGQVAEAKKNSFDPTGQLKQMNPGNIQVEANFADQTASILEQRGQGIQSCEQTRFVVAQISALMSNLGVQGQTVQNQVDPVQLVEDSVNVLANTTNTLAQAETMANQVVVACKGMVEENQRLQGELNDARSATQQAGGLVPGAGQFAGSPFQGPVPNFSPAVHNAVPLF